MLTVCERFAKCNNMQFSTNDNPAKSKSKAVFVTGTKQKVVPQVSLVLYGKNLPWVEHCEHLGTVINSSVSMDQDCQRKKAEFIDSSVKIREAFSFAHPCEIIGAVQKYCTSYYGAPLWSMRDESVRMINASWRTNVKMTWDTPRNCHNYFIDTILAQNETPPEISLPVRFVNFFCSLQRSSSPEIQILSNLCARDIRTNTGSNLSFIKSLTGLDIREYGANRIKDELQRVLSPEVPVMDRWRLPYLEKLLANRCEAFYNGDSDHYNYLNELIHSLVTN